MRFSTLIFTSALSVLGFGSPTVLPGTPGAAAIAPREISMMPAAPQWTIEVLQRACNPADTSCKWSFRINDKSGAPATQCSFTIKGKPASQTGGAGFKCGVYTVGAGWSGAFGPGNGFTTLSVVNSQTRNIVWPAYTDKQLAGARVVSPDQSYAPVKLA
ncbi:uncharacterized protein B0I36DRAFT_255551 [Microdochium trichocladiopsis]|uniref:Small secreted protein n=1 Tax=Microdochium trichocladiopsis TaxID=1682393 RepID=A0A9P8XVD5_9PEZI|nr:uncharacterized protein B0I36DRAFT_255551 [Microdochium trichocladiopsis]KAH7014487.1 hypothetical protein B0I36DRAFT_255551 [Microdochium trichocladiopsis]